VSVSVALSDVRKGGTRGGQNFPADLHSLITLLVRLDLYTEFGTVTQVCQKHISRGSATSPDPISRGGAQASPNIFGTPDPKWFDLERQNLVR